MLIRALRAPAGRWPRVEFPLARALAWLLQPLGRGVAEDTLAVLFPELGPRQLRAARRRSWSNFVQSEALAASIQRSGKGLADPEILPDRDLAALRPPLILASFHIGVYTALGALLRALPSDVLVVHRGRLAERPGVTLMYRGDDEWERAGTFHRAVTHLRGGGLVFTTLDGGYREGGYEAATVAAPMLGGTISLARGGFALARMSRTPIMPVAARRCGRKVAITFGDPISPGLGEDAMAAAAAQWLGDYLRESPGEVSLRTLEVLRPPPGR